MLGYPGGARTSVWLGPGVNGLVPAVVMTTAANAAMSFDEVFIFVFWLGIGKKRRDAKRNGRAVYVVRMGRDCRKFATREPEVFVSCNGCDDQPGTSSCKSKDVVSKPTH